MRLTRAVWAAGVLGLVTVASPSFAQKQGGTLRISHRDNPPSASIHEESTISVVQPFMAVFNNLVVFDPKEKVNSPDHIVGDLADSWSWSDDKTKLTFKLHQGVKWHDGQPFTSKDVKCTWDALAGKDSDIIRKDPRKIWYNNLKDVTTNGDYEVTFVLGRPEPSFLTMLAGGYSPVYSCHVPDRVMRSKPIGTGPFKVVDFKRNESIKLVRNPDYFKKGKPYLDAIDWKIVPNRSTRLLGFQSGEFDMTFDSDVTFPLLKDVMAQKPNAVCEARPTNVNSNILINRDAPPFDNPQVRKALVLALDIKAFNQILSQGHDLDGAAMLPPPAGFWGMPADMLATLPGHSPDVEKSRAEARKIMEGLGYGPNKPLKIKVATRNIAIYRDPAVILIDQLKQIYIDGELDPIDTTIWYNKIAKKDYQLGMNLTGIGIDDPDVNFYENFYSTSDRNYTGYKNAEVDKLIDQQSAELDMGKRKKIVWEIEKKLADDVARPVIGHNVANTCWDPKVKGLVLQVNSIYNGWRFEDVWLDK
ncbi:peptide/nickel transport system substrate-binding protein [Enhydrobacter aerosaccus]|uniref:Peptide/nickel transport system substrate-binding protein n=1 Tax=Enhydrobacter aerosaccus TaxID=225324 RepID=A0A1T4R6M9_9HYPH|nr:ABC transporter substrate-binding protein [Enhydrobacter aerosaccus]SKA11595.1 peptide/nickel transport system substrate-binding protein [Enhydrobacter aerosaccus]